MRQNDGKQRKKVFYIDPQSMHHPAIYDYFLLAEISADLTYFCSKYLDQLRHNHITYKPVFAYNNIKSDALKAVSYILSYAAILWYVLTLRPDVIHVQWYKIPRLDYMFYKVVKALSKTHIVFTAHNVLPHNTGEKYATIYAKLYRLVDHIIVHTQRSKTEIAEQFGIDQDKIHVIRHGLTRLTYDEKKYDEEKAYYARKYKTDNKLVFASVGEQSPYKGVDIVAEVWATTKELRQNNDCLLLMVGRQKGVDLSQLEGIENVYIENRRISNEEFLYVLRHTDVYLLLYRNISQSGTLLDAMAEHVPVLVTDVGGLTEPMKVGRVGWIAEKADVESVRRAMTALVKDKEAVKAVRQNEADWKKVEQTFNWHDIGLATQRLYDEA